MATGEADKKILADLGTLTEKIELCKEIIKQTGGTVDLTNEALLGVIGFLEACEPRMVELVESATQGTLQESTLMKCLNVNDSLIKILSFCSGETQFEISAAKAAASNNNLDDIDLNDLILDDSNDNNVSKISSTIPTGPLKSDFSDDLDDFFTSEGKYPKPTTGSTIDTLNGSNGNGLKMPTSASTKNNEFDEFDAFLNDRTSSSRDANFLKNN